MDRGRWALANLHCYVRDVTVSGFRKKYAGKTKHKTEKPKRQMLEGPQKFPKKFPKKKNRRHRQSLDLLRERNEADEGRRKGVHSFDPNNDTVILGES
ncbi:hypothetical protein R1flu_025857 [Riccia fluitans]|uniref:Uncharacterized protein n=1 Tax=Riccia fluitans TaxID=41844 RepID=A0ABD1XYY2_9MARC